VVRLGVPFPLYRKRSSSPMVPLGLVFRGTYEPGPPMPRTSSISCSIVRIASHVPAAKLSLRLKSKTPRACLPKNPFTYAREENLAQVRPPRQITGPDFKPLR
jgi:hypothetical protein